MMQNEHRALHLERRSRAIVRKDGREVKLCGYFTHLHLGGVLSADFADLDQGRSYPRPLASGSLLHILAQ
jgi:hypothetical protein